MKYQLTDEQIQRFREITPIMCEGKLVPFKIVCDGKFYQDPRGKAKCIVYLTDFSCSLTDAMPGVKKALQKIYVNFMSEEFEDYADDYQAILEQKAEKETELNS